MCMCFDTVTMSLWENDISVVHVLKVEIFSLVTVSMGDIVFDENFETNGFAPTNLTLKVHDVTFWTICLSTIHKMLYCVLLFR